VPRDVPRAVIGVKSIVRVRSCLLLVLQTGALVVRGLDCTGCLDCADSDCTCPSAAELPTIRIGILVDDYWGRAASRARNVPDRKKTEGLLWHY
jgi:hypothetical protein